MGIKTWIVAIALAVAVVGATPAASLADDPALDTLTPIELLPLIYSYSTSQTAQDADLLKNMLYLYVLLGGDPTLLPDLPAETTP